MENMENNEHFVIDNDQKADWALRKIREERSELERLSELAAAQKAEIDFRLDAAKKRCEQETGSLLALLGAYFDTVPHRKTKTQEQYRLLSGSLVRKLGGIDYQRDDGKLTGWMMEHEFDELVDVKVTPKWGSFKRLLTADPETGVVVLAETGEVVEGLKAERKSDTFDVKY
jgi:hypothetical protein